MTNLEKIQNKGAWDMAKFIKDVSDNATEITTCNEDCMKCEYAEDFCIYKIAEWLNKEVEGK